MATNIYDYNAEGQINAMLLSAKKGNWDVVFDILENKPYLINCISSDKAWGVLHQAAWMNLFPVVKQIVNIPGCDPSIKTRQDSARKHGPGKTPRELSTNHGIKCYLLEAERRSSCSSQMLFAPTFVIIQSELELTGKSITLALSCFKKVLCSHLEFQNDYSFTFIMKTIFQECLTNWLKIKSKICLALEVDNSHMSKFIQHGFTGKFDTIDQFFSRVIQVYTDERDHVCHSLNATLALQGNERYIPKGHDIALAGYAILLNAILMNWKALNKCKRYTYHCVGLNPYNLSLYTVGTKFTWLSFASSSVDRNVVGIFPDKNLIQVTFIIDNKSCNRWSPRYIGAHSSFPDEKECLYPCGTCFVVTGVNGVEIHLKLCNY